MIDLQHIHEDLNKERGEKMKKSRPHNRRLVGTYNKEDDLYYFLFQEWNKDKQEYETTKDIVTERFELNER